MSVRIQFDREDLRPLVQLAVAEALGHLEAERAKFNGRLAYPETEAAGMLGLAKHQLRDVRLRCEIEHTRIAGRVFYTREQLSDFLDRSKA